MLVESNFASFFNISNLFETIKYPTAENPGWRYGGLEERGSEQPSYPGYRGRNRCGILETVKDSSSIRVQIWIHCSLDDPLIAMMQPFHNWKS